MVSFTRFDFGSSRLSLCMKRGVTHVAIVPLSMKSRRTSQALFRLNQKEDPRVAQREAWLAVDKVACTLTLVTQQRRHFGPAALRRHVPTAFSTLDRSDSRLVSITVLAKGWDDLKSRFADIATFGSKSPVWFPPSLDRDHHLQTGFKSFPPFAGTVVASRLPSMGVYGRLETSGLHDCTPWMAAPEPSANQQRTLP